VEQTTKEKTQQQLDQRSLPLVQIDSSSFLCNINFKMSNTLKDIIFCSSDNTLFPTESSLPLPHYPLLLSLHTAMLANLWLYERQEVE